MPGIMNNPWGGQQTNPVLPQFSNNPNINNTIVQVNGFESAKQFSTLPNRMYALFDSNEDIVYIKSTDSSNYPMYRKFQLVEIKDEVPAQTGNYVTVEEFEKFKEEILNGQQYIRKSSNPKHANSKWKSNATESANDDPGREGNG